MGDWSRKAWGNDAAADWFQRYWKAPGVAAIVDEVANFDPGEERYDELRAACHLLECLGIAYVWPADQLPTLKPTLVGAIRILRQMIDPPDDTWGFLDMWGDDPEVIAEVEAQIDALEARLADLA